MVASQVATLNSLFSGETARSPPSTKATVSTPEVERSRSPKDKTRKSGKKSKSHAAGGPLNKGTPSQLFAFVLGNEVQQQDLLEFLVAFRYFMTPRDLLLRLITKHKSAPPVERFVAEQLKEQAVWRAKVPVQARVADVLRYWLTEHFYDFEGDDVLFRSLLSFIEAPGLDAAAADQLRLAIQKQCEDAVLHILGPASGTDVVMEALCKPSTPVVSELVTATRTIPCTVIGSELVTWLMKNMDLRSRAEAARICAQLIDRRMLDPIAAQAGFRDDSSVYAVIGRSVPTYPAPRVPASIPLLPSVSDFKIQELARQFTKASHDMFRLVQANEVKSKAWTAPDAVGHLPALLAISSRLTQWVASEILMTKAFDLRVVTLRKMISLGKYMLALNNYNGMFAILDGLSLPAVSRLARSWAALPPKSLATMERLRALANPANDCECYRRTVKEAAKPAFPHVGLALADIGFVEDSGADLLGPGERGEELVNYKKLRLLAQIYMNLQSYQKIPYELLEIEPIQDYLSKTIVISDSVALGKLGAALLAEETR
jgi:hypothetical protein